MACERSNLVQAHYDGELPSGEAAALRRHLERCADCRKLLAELRAVSTAVASARLRRPSQMTQRRLRHAPRLRREQSVRRLTGWLTATAAAIVLATWVLPTRNQAPPPRYAQGTDAPVIGAALFGGADENVPEVVLAAHWMASDLSAPRVVEP